MTLLGFRPFALLLCCLLYAGACAHRSPNEGMDGLRKAIAKFEQRVRWKDFPGCMQMLVPQQREPFDEARRAKNDEKDLSVTEIETDDAQVSPDGTRAMVISRYSWIRLPSTSVQTERVTSEWVFAQGTWFLYRQVGGPFGDELGLAPAAPKPADE